MKKTREILNYNFIIIFFKKTFSEPENVPDEEVAGKEVKTKGKIPKVEDLLEESELTEFKDKFEEEGIKTEHLIQMTENDLKEAMKELGMKKLGDRWKLLRNLRPLKNLFLAEVQNVQEEVEENYVIQETQEETLTETTSEETHDEETQDNCLPVCRELRKSSHPMHRCRYCSAAVSQICPCNEEDPESDNPQHRVHTRKELCIAKPSEEIFCDKCGKKAKDIEALECHKAAVHAKFSCDECPARFNIRGLLKEHEELHRELREPRSKRPRVEINVDKDTGDVDIMDDTVIDKNFEPTHDDEELLREDEEEEEEGFDFSCKHCKFKTNLKEDLKHHLAWNHKKMKKTGTANQKTCDECGKAFAQTWNLRRHKEKVHIVVS